MRASRITLSEVARNAAGTSRSGARLPILHQSLKRRAPPQPIHLQDLVNQAMKPTFLASALLAPAPRSNKPSSSTTPANKPTKTLALASPVKSTNNTEATESKVYDNRAQLIVRLIRLNRILSAMTAFVADVSNQNRTPFSPKQLEVFITAMRIQSKKHASTRPAPKQSEGLTEDLWRPSRLDASISAKSLSIPTQCMYAMATIYDVCIERKYQPTAKMVSAMLSTFVGHLDPGQMLQAADTALRHLVPPTALDQDSYLRRINHSALSSFISTFGRIDRPERGEDLLARWAKAQRTKDTPQNASLLPDGEVIDLSGWGNNIVVWQSLIKAWVDANHLPGARKWLDRYRKATRQLESCSLPGSTPSPRIAPEPYLAYMAGIRDAAMRAKGPRRIGAIASKLREAVQLMITDGVPVESSVLAFIIGFEAKTGNVAGGASLVDELGSIIEASVHNDADLLRALLQIRKAAADAEAPAPQSASASPPAPSKNKNLPSTRSLIRSLVRVGDGQVTTSTDNLASCRSRGTLNYALMTTMAEHDYPAAVVVLNLFERWRIQPSHTTYSIVLDALVAQGHHPALFAQPGEVTDSNSKFNLEATLQSMAREGNGEQAEAIRKVLTHQPFAGEGFSVSARPSATLRQTQYLIRILNRVCAAEIENVDPDRVIPAWLVTRRNAERDASEWLSQEAVWKRVRTSIYAAQDDMLGKKEERSTRVKVTTKSPLFTSVPTLSPRRWGIRSPSKKISFGSGSSRAFTTSAVAGNDSGASCDLAAAAKGDHTQPVRAIYIPGFVPYHLGLALQEHLVKQRSDARAALRALADTTSDSASTIAGLSTVEPSASEAHISKQASQDTLLLLQHRPVYTEGRRHDSENELVSNHLRSLGADYHLTKRGGQITYHGPGQLVGYPILNLASMSLASRCYVDRIQDSLISLLADRGIPTVPPPDDHTGVWADEYHKIASIGIQVRHRISSHGFALNVEKRAMQGFKHIVACGIVGRSMTCVQDRLDPNGAFAKYNIQPLKDGSVNRLEKVESVAESYKEHFSKVFGRRVRDTSLEEFVFELKGEEYAEKLLKGLQIAVEAEELVVDSIMVDGRLVLA